LVDIAQKNSDACVVSIFVNPKQFAEGEDLDKYPRTVDDDISLLKNKGVDMVYLPSVDDIYNKGFDIKISIGDIKTELEGVTRPHFFDGVALVVTKLFMQIQPDIAVFGEKDFQQLHVIRKLVSDFDMAVKIIGGEVIREKDGLAMSSRNRYLSKKERPIASGLYQVMCDISSKVKNDENVEDVLKWGEKELLKMGFDRVDYLEIRDCESLLRTEKLPARLLAAVYLSGVRLIDNIEII
jgi:pantoate--beta-alanine ligase